MSSASSVFSGPDAPLRRLKEAGEIVIMSAAAKPVDPDQTGCQAAQA
jgi:hypothetical protein